MEATKRLPRHAQNKLCVSTIFWLNKSQLYGPCKEDPIEGKGACFHPAADWLIENGERAEKAGGVEFYSMKDYFEDRHLWGPGGVILHELCHAYHAKFVPDGYNNTAIQECFKSAMDRKLYEKVRVHGPQGPTCKAYACSCAEEYFAELSVAFLSKNDEEEFNKWFPFNNSQLKQHDRQAYDLLKILWSG